MSRKTNTTIAAFTVRADELVEGNIIKHVKTGDIWQIISEPEYTSQGITFEVMWLSDTQNSCFIHAQTHQRFELVSHQSNQLSITEPQGLKDTAHFVHAHVHRGQLIGILSDKAGFKFCIYEPGSLLEESCLCYSDVGAALNAAIERVDADSQWKVGFQAYESGQPFPKIADPNFICGWRDGWQAHQGVA